MKQERLLNRRAIAVGLLWVGMSLALCAQEADPTTPPQRVPRTPERQPTPAPVVEQTKPVLNPEDDKILLNNLVGIVIVKSRQEVKEEGVSGVAGLKVVDIPLLNDPEVAHIAARYLNRGVSKNDIRSLENDLILFSRSKNRPLVDVFLPDQDITSGVIQLYFLEGKVGKVSVENEGKKWFSDDFIASQVRLHPGSVVDMQMLTEDLDWVNRNPFRQVNTVFKAGEQLGQADVVLRVDDRVPFRVYAGYENSGTEFTGEDRLLAGFNWGNVFGLDHQLNYQYTTDVEFDAIKAHSVSYLVPFPWRHTLSLLGAYADTLAEFEDTSTVGDGRSYQASVRYGIPQRVNKNYIQEFTVGFDFKRTDNDLEFGGSTQSSTDTEVAQFEAGYTGLLIDDWGQTSFGIEGYYSPGDLTAHNNDEDFDELRPDSKATYVYGRATLERITRLPGEFSWILRGFGQLASERLTPSEQIGIGGFGTVRGYGERTANGDHGFVINNELRTPSMPICNWLGIPWQDRLQFLGFFDYGKVRIKEFGPEDQGADREVRTVFYSVGAGLRYSLYQNLTIRFDYGWQLTDEEGSNDSGWHLGAILSF